MGPRSCSKNLAVEFSERNYRDNTAFCEEFCFQIRIPLFNAPVFNFWNLAALRKHFLNCGWFLLTFEMTNFPFSAKFFFEVMKVTLNLRFFLLVVLRLISPKFSTWSLALHKNVVNDVVKRLSTFASLALSNSGPMCFVYIHTRFLYTSRFDWPASGR